MPKRFTSTEKWDDPWYRSLSPRLKSFWQFLCDKCDNAGVWKIDYSLATFFVGEKITELDIKDINNGKQRVTVKDDLVIILDYIPFQIGDLKNINLTNLQKNCLETLNKYHLTGKLPVDYPYSTGIGKGKGKGIGKGKKNQMIDTQATPFVPPFLNNSEIQTLWGEWLTVRRKMRVPNTNKALALAAAKLAKWGEAKSTVALKNAIEKGWRGLFEPKDNEVPKEEKWG